jgi:threonine synthase
LEQGYPVSLRLDYATDHQWRVQQAAGGMRRYAAQLPYVDFPTLGEGATPLVELAPLARTLGVDRLWAKNEGQNPTGSHKDRMSALVVARAASLGRRTVVAASSGNGGASLAAYAGAATLRCAIISTPAISRVWARAIRMAGGELILTETSQERWRYMWQMVEEEGWYPVTNYLYPPIGSNPFGVQGYKTVAYEIIEQCGGMPPTVIMVPTSRGDLLWGLWEGLVELRRNALLHELPRLIAVEPVPRLSRVLAGEDYRQTFDGASHALVSVGGTTATYQAVLALRESMGSAVEVSTTGAEAAQQELAQRGLYVELSSAASLAGLRELLKSGHVDGADRVVLVLTSHGYKAEATKG